MKKKSCNTANEESYLLLWTLKFFRTPFVIRFMNFLTFRFSHFKIYSRLLSHYFDYFASFIFSVWSPPSSSLSHFISLFRQLHFDVHLGKAEITENFLHGVKLFFHSKSITGLIWRKFFCSKTWTIKNTLLQKKRTNGNTRQKLSVCLYRRRQINNTFPIIL
jgi:hypothetical protein